MKCCLDGSQIRYLCLTTFIVVFALGVGIPAIFGNVATTQPLSAEQIADIKVVFIVANVLGIVSSLLGISITIYRKQYKTFSVRVLLAAVCFCVLYCLCNLVSLGVPAGSGCVAVGAFCLFASLNIITWMINFCFVIFESVILGQPLVKLQTLERYLHIFAWGWSLVPTITLLVAGVGGKSGLVCLILPSAARWRWLLLISSASILAVGSAVVFFSVAFQLVKSHTKYSANSKSNRNITLTLKLLLSFFIILTPMACSDAYSVVAVVSDVLTTTTALINNVANSFIGLSISSVMLILYSSARERPTNADVA